MKLFRNKHWFLTVLATVLFLASPAKAQVTIGSVDPPKAFSILELISNDSGLRLPQLNETEREALKNELLTLNDVAAKGLVIFNTKINCVEFWSGTDWISLCQPSKPFLSVSTLNLFFDYRGNPVQNVTVITTIPEGWMVESVSDSWIEVSPLVGVSSTGISLSVNAVRHTGTGTRTGSITIKAGTLTETINVSQIDETEVFGEGTIENPYIILTPEQLDAVRLAPDLHYKVGKNIDLSEYLAPGGAGYDKWLNKGWLPIGDALSPPFIGSFDGDRYIISGLWLERSETGSIPVGLFGFIEDGTVKNTKIDLYKGVVNGIPVNGIHGGPNTFVGGLAGRVTGVNGIIRNCGVSGNGEVRGSNSVGGVVGRVDLHGSIAGCYSTVNVGGNNGIGGIVGMVSSSEISERGGTMSDCYATGTIDGTTGVGGIVGRVQWDGFVSNCYATGNIWRSATPNATNFLSGVSGRIDSHGHVTNCVGLNLEVSTTFGTDIGRVSANWVTNSYLINNYGRSDMDLLSNGTPTPPTNSPSSIDGATITSTDYESQNWWKTASNWYTSSIESAWDFTKIWKWDEDNDRPILKWQ